MEAFPSAAQAEFLLIGYVRPEGRNLQRPEVLRNLYRGKRTSGLKSVCENREKPQR
jgi:hypothetical protein